MDRGRPSSGQLNVVWASISPSNDNCRTSSSGPGSTRAVGGRSRRDKGVRGAEGAHRWSVTNPQAPPPRSLPDGPLWVREGPRKVSRQAPDDARPRRPVSQPPSRPRRRRNAFDERPRTQPTEAPSGPRSCRRGEGRDMADHDPTRLPTTGPDRPIGLAVGRWAGRRSASACPTARSRSIPPRALPPTAAETRSRRRFESLLGPVAAAVSWPRPCRSR
jgi:hypothetical protein